ncbi:MAG: histidine kinase [Actinomycetota bacterium]
MRRDLRTALIGLAVAGAAFAAVCLALILTSDHQSPTDPDVVFLAGNIGFIETGLLTWWRRPDNRFGALMAATGFAGLLNHLTASNEAAVFTLGLFVANLVAPVAAHMLLAFPSGQLRPAEMRIVALFWAVATVLSWPALLFTASGPARRGPWPENLALVTPNDAVVTTFGILRGVVAGAGVIAALAVLVGRWRRAEGLQRRAMAPVLTIGVLTGLVWGVLVTVDGVDPESGAVPVLQWVMVVYALIPVAFVLGLVRGRMFGAGAVRLVVAGLGDAAGPGGLRDRLAVALGDPTLTLAYWLPDQGRYVDTAGRPVELPAPGSGRAVTPVETEGRVVAALVHDVSLAAADADTVRAAGGAVALALENERLDAELRANIAELAASRARIIEAADAARRRIERDLHDGAQQRLVAVALSLRMARGRIRDDPATAAELLDAAGAELDQALAELRELARGIHPAVLTDRGLGPALAALAGRSPVPVELDADIDGGLPAPVEAAAYFVAAEALTNVARYARATHARICVARVAGAARIEVRDDGVGGADPDAGSGLRGLADRVAALDGRLEVVSPPGGGTIVRAVIPCGS